VAGHTPPLSSFLTTTLFVLISVLISGWPQKWLVTDHPLQVVSQFCRSHLASAR